MSWRRYVGGVLVLLALPAVAGAAEGGPDLPVWTVAPFVLLLLAIAVLPLAAHHFWERNRNKLLVALLLAAPAAAYLVNVGAEGALWVPHEALRQHTESLPPAVQGALRREGTHALLHELGQYASFIILLGSLYTVSGGIILRGSLRGRPLTNAFFLATGAALANLIGTTGASMLLIRPVLRINRERQYARHIPIFFIFLVSNLGGLLTPLGDPPLYLGFLRGIDFFWTVQLWPQWLLANGLVLGVFLVWDTAAYLREPKRPEPAVPEAEPLRVEGLINLLFLAGIVAGVLFHAPPVADGARAWLSQFFDCPDLTLRTPWAEAVLLAMALLSWLVTARRLRVDNGFTWGPILEVAFLFLGIFVTMVPALVLLRAHGREFGLSEPWQYFWLTGGLSSFLDNAPTYLVFASLAASPNEVSSLPATAPLLLQAISCGAVFMGANTYIGNGPNFMVKAIASEAGYRTPSFFGYMAYSGLILLPIFAVVSYVFFRPAALPALWP
jgi:Na+/H+ antiporter NhaD/arsenite permease-like protein